MSKRIRIVVVVAVAVVCVACAALLALLMGRSRRAAETAWQVQYALGMWHLSEGGYEAAAAAFAAAVDIDPKQSGAYTRLADARLEMGDREAAMEALEEGYARTKSSDIAAFLTALRAELANDGADGMPAAGDAASVLERVLLELGLGTPTPAPAAGTPAAGGVTSAPTSAPTGSAATSAPASAPTGSAATSAPASAPTGSAATSAPTSAPAGSAATSAPASGPSALEGHNLEQLDMTTFSLRESETITVRGVVQRNAPFPAYRLKLDRPVEITLSSSSSAYDEAIVEEFSCEYLYFYDEDMVAYDFDVEQLVGCRCVITARLENYRGGGNLYLLYPLLSVVETAADTDATEVPRSEFIRKMSDAWAKLAGAEYAAEFEEAFLEFAAFRDTSPAFPADWFSSFFDKEIVSWYGAEDGWAERIVGGYYARWSSDPDPWYDNPVDDMIEGFYGDDCGD